MGVTGRGIIGNHGSSHFTILQADFITYGDRLRRHHPYVRPGSDKWEIHTRDEERETETEWGRQGPEHKAGPNRQGSFDQSQ